MKVLVTEAKLTKGKVSNENLAYYETFEKIARVVHAAPTKKSIHKFKFNNLLLILVFMLVTKISVSQTISLVEAPGKGKVKVMTTYGKIFEFDKIEQIDSIYYGINGNDEILILPEDVSEIQLVIERESKEFKNSIFVSKGLVEFALNRGAYSTLNVNYERRINKYLSTRLSYGRSFKSHGLLSEDSFVDIAFLKDAFGSSDAPSKKTFYTTSFCFTTSNPTSNFDLSVGYALIKIDPYTDYYYSYKSETLHSPALEVGYRYTKDSFIFRTGVGWPYGRYMSIGYAF